MTSLPSRGRVCAALRALSFGALLLMPGLVRAAEPTLEIAAGGETRSYTRDELLARPDAATIEVAKDITYGGTYGGPMTYRAVPVAALLSGLNFSPDSVMEAVAIDGFAPQIPLDLLRNTDASKAIAWVAIETADHPWPKIAGKDYSAGPLHVVWTGPEAASIRSEYWAYHLAKFESQLSPGSRWPGLAVDRSLPADDPVRAGQTLYIAQCLPCHKLNGGGASDVGPDLNLPMNATEYMTEAGLHALIRDPKSVRTWPGQKMGGFPPSFVSDREIGLIVGYLKHMAGRKVAP